MRILKCDFCTKQISASTKVVTLIGVGPRYRGRILLPDGQGWNLDFCDSNCFWDWIDRDLKTGMAGDFEQMVETARRNRDGVTAKV